jgi:hypothetical protein
MDRRDALKAVLGSIIATCACGKAHAQTSANGCFVSAASFADFENTFHVQETTGLSFLDANITHEANLMEEVFGVKPGLSFFVEPPTMGGNAFATSDRYFSPDHDGTVLMGMRLMQSEMDSVDGNGQHRITCVLAHEYAHIYQIKKSHLRAMPQTWRELHADFLAGWYLGYRSVEGLQIGSKTSDALLEKGDYAFNDPNHHGTPDQRLIMTLEGWRFARNDPNWRRVSRASEFGASRLRPVAGGWAVVPSISLD